MVALAIYRASVKDHWKAREKELINRLTPKAASFFQMGFEGVVKQFATRGYFPYESDSDFLDCVAALAEYPPEAFNL